MMSYNALSEQFSFNLSRCACALIRNIVLYVLFAVFGQCVTLFCLFYDASFVGVFGQQNFVIYVFSYIRGVFSFWGVIIPSPEGLTC